MIDKSVQTVQKGALKTAIDSASVAQSQMDCMGTENPLSFETSVTTLAIFAIKL